MKITQSKQELRETFSRALRKHSEKIRRKVEKDLNVRLEPTKVCTSYALEYNIYDEENNFVRYIAISHMCSYSELVETVKMAFYASCK